MRLAEFALDQPGVQHGTCRECRQQAPVVHAGQIHPIGPGTEFDARGLYCLHCMNMRGYTPRDEHGNELTGVRVTAGQRLTIVG